VSTVQGDLNFDQTVNEHILHILAMNEKQIILSVWKQLLDDYLHSCQTEKIHTMDHLHYRLNFDLTSLDKNFITA
jgi:hypothetical protein